MDKIDKKENYLQPYQPIFSNSPLKMSETDFSLFRRLVYEKTGINMTEKKLTLLSNRLRRRLRALNLETYHKYYLYLKNHPNSTEEIVKMIDAVTTNVTQFFRNPKQINNFKEKILPVLFTQNKVKRNIRILSAGCSTGEEPYSIAIVFKEFFAEELKTYAVQIHAVDISKEVIQKAEDGKYPVDELNALDKKMIEKYFIKLDDNTYQVTKELKSLVTFNKFNLVADDFSAKYDAVFCRNVVIYFNKEIKQLVYQKLYDALYDYGYFLVGHSEGLINDKKFQFIVPGIYKKNVLLAGKIKGLDEFISREVSGKD